MIKISIITINYNNKSGLELTLESVLNQSFTNYEYIVIDGGSNDGSKEIIERDSKRFSYWVSEKDNGIYHAMNKGVEHVNGEYVLYLNSGDYLHNKDVLQNVAPFLDGTDIVYGDLMRRFGGRDEFKRYPDNLSFNHFVKYSIPHQASFVRKKQLLKNGPKPFDESFDIVSDWKFLMNSIILDKATYKHIDLIISYFPLDGISANPENVRKVIQERDLVLKKDYNLFFSLVDENRVLEGKLNKRCIINCLKINLIKLLKKLNVLK